MTNLKTMLDALDAAVKAATPGPWSPETWVEQDGDGWVARGPLRRDDDDDDREPDGPSHLLAQKDAELMAAAVNLAPTLLGIALAAARYRAADAAIFDARLRDPKADMYLLFSDRAVAESALFAALDSAEAEAKP